MQSDRGAESNRCRVKERPASRAFRGKGDSGVQLFSQFFGLCHPFVALDASVEAEIIVDPFDLGLFPGRDLVEVVDTQTIQNALNLGSDA